MEVVWLKLEIGSILPSDFALAFGGAFGGGSKGPHAFPKGFENNCFRSRLPNYLVADTRPNISDSQSGSISMQPH